MPMYGIGHAAYMDTYRGVGCFGIMLENQGSPADLRQAFLDEAERRGDHARTDLPITRMERRWSTTCLI